MGNLEFLSARFKNHCYRSHSHPGYVVGVVTAGREAFYCRGTIHKASKGDIILINPDSQHDGEAASEGGWQYRVIYPTETHLAGLGGSGFNPRFRHSLVRDEELATRISTFHQSVEKNHCATEREALWLDIAWDLVARHGETSPEETYEYKDPNRIQIIQNILSNEATSSITLDEVAKRVGWTTWHMVRSFKAALGISPHAYLVDRRLHRARSLIDDGVEIAMAASEAGFVDQSHFSRHFVAAYGFTPGRYRQEMRA